MAADKGEQDNFFSGPRKDTRLKWNIIRMNAVNTCLVVLSRSMALPQISLTVDKPWAAKDEIRLLLDVASKVLVRAVTCSWCCRDCTMLGRTITYQAHSTTYQEIKSVDSTVPYLVLVYNCGFSEYPMSLSLLSGRMAWLVLDIFSIWVVWSSSPPTPWERPI
jgi:hypothetical protein